MVSQTGAAILINVDIYGLKIPELGRFFIVIGVRDTAAPVVADIGMRILAKEGC
jgi:hypothetical protein